LNQYVWSNGIRFIPRKVRVRMTRRKNEDEEAKTKFYTLVEHVPVESYEGLKTEISKLRQ
jgi:large subunit ribosomal protein L31e